MGVVDFALLTISSMIAVMEPFSTTAVYVTLTKTMDSGKKREIIRRSMVVSFVVLVFFALTGHLLFRVFGITIPAFQIAGGLGFDISDEAFWEKGMRQAEEFIRMLEETL